MLENNEATTPPAAQTPAVEITPPTSTENKPAVETETSTEKHLRQTDEIFTELTAAVSNSPEAKQQALTTLIEQMQQIADQITKVRDIRNLTELKLEMMKSWNKIREAAAGNEQLESAIYDWADKFNEAKVLFHDNILEVKDKLVDANSEMQDVWSEAVVLLGQIAAKSGDPMAFHTVDGILFKRNRNFALFERTLETKHLRGQASPMADFATSVDKLTSVYEGDLDMTASREARAAINRALLTVSAAVGESKNSAELAKDMESLNTKIQQLHGKIRDIIKIYMVAKKLRDVRFDTVLNQRPPWVE